MPKHADGFELKERDSSPFWQAHFYIDSPDGTRKRHRESTSVLVDGGDRAEANRQAAALYVKALEEARGGGAAGDRPAVPSSVLEQLDLAKLIADYSAHEKRAYSGSDKQHHYRIETDLVLYCRTRWSRVEEITTDAWEQAKIDLHKRNKGPLGARSLAHLANTLRHFLRWCCSRGYIPSVPELKAPSRKQQKAEKAPRAAMDRDQIEAFLWAVALLGERRALHVYTVAFETWQRKGTLEALAPRWCNFKKETILVPAQYMKNRKEKLIDMTPRCAEAIRAEMDRRAAEGESIGLDEPIFGPVNFYDKHANGTGIFKRACGLAGIDTFALAPHHSTRHSAATNAAAEGASLLAMMAQGAWDSAQIIEENYLHPNLAHARTATRSA